MLTSVGSSLLPTADGADKGRYNNPSALQCACVGLKQMSYVYADSSNAQCCIHAAASAGTACFGPNMVVSVLWSISSIHFRPYKLVLTFFNSKHLSQCLFLYLWVVPFIV